MENRSLLDWHSMFMGVALLAAARSKDARKRNGACIASADYKILGVGDNGLPRLSRYKGAIGPNAKSIFALGPTPIKILQTYQNITSAMISMPIAPCRLAFSALARKAAPGSNAASAALPALMS